MISPEQLIALVREAVREALDDAASIRRADWISIRQSGLPRPTVKKLIKSGVLRAAKVGRELRINSSDLEKHMLKSAEKNSEPSEVIEATDAFEAARARARAERRSA